MAAIPRVPHRSTGSVSVTVTGVSWAQGPSREFSQKQQEMRSATGLGTRLQHRSKVHQETGPETHTPVTLLRQSLKAPAQASMGLLHQVQGAQMGCPDKASQGI